MVVAVEVIAWIILAIFALRGARWAYAIFIILALVWIPARTGFHLHRPPCNLQIVRDLAVSSMLKYKHIVLFGMFFLMTRVQLPRNRYAALIAFAATLAVGILIELEEGATGTGMCKLVDLFPDAEGALLAEVVWRIWKRDRGIQRASTESMP